MKPFDDVDACLRGGGLAGAAVMVVVGGDSSVVDRTERFRFYTDRFDLAERTAQP